ncbi:MAG: UDP-N-acetylglucosamine 2-epimerase (hydrolyzing) [Phycisphaeraceae bacterium]|nr:UDP-N-acetylglucosamine 2-epimerase (hydrolyzing) [Phycisphaerales bacterium]MCB9860244.1 UDP-N-acetylglucosamine 2-epimerase (hydrolyzing) [Phycisphaeraceae bacterium]
MPDAPSTRNVIVVTGTRAEFGLLLPVMRAIDAHPTLTLHVIATGTHLLQSGATYREVKAAFPHAIAVPMQVDGRRTRADDAEATGNGITRFARVFAHNGPDWVVVLGDRIEVFAAASAASIGGWTVAHIHGGDRAEGIADEAMRHAITKLSHLHLAATSQSAQRITKMGEPVENVHCVGSPAIDALTNVTAFSDDEAIKIANGADWRSIVLLHPAGLDEAHERAWARTVLDGIAQADAGPALVLSPNHDAGRDWIANELDALCETHAWPRVDHLPRETFLRALKWCAEARFPLVGNSSAGLIEAAALGVPVVNLGPRQAGRERAGALVDVESPDTSAIADAISRAKELAGSSPAHPYGDGNTGTRIAELLASTDPRAKTLLRKRNAY